MPGVCSSMFTSASIELVSPPPLEHQRYLQLRCVTIIDQSYWSVTERSSLFHNIPGVCSSMFTSASIELVSPPPLEHRTYLQLRYVTIIDQSYWSVTERSSLFHNIPGVCSSMFTSASIELVSPPPLEHQTYLQLLCVTIIDQSYWSVTERSSLSHW